MSKAARIRALAAQGLTTRQIAADIYGVTAETPGAVADRSMAYIRVVLRQRQGGKVSAHDKVWRARNPDKCRAYSLRSHQRRLERDPDYRTNQFKARYHSDPEFRARHLTYHRNWRLKKAREANHMTL